MEFLSKIGNFFGDIGRGGDVFAQGGNFDGNATWGNKLGMALEAFTPFVRDYENQKAYNDIIKNTNNKSFADGYLQQQQSAQDLIDDRLARMRARREENDRKRKMEEMAKKLPTVSDPMGGWLRDFATQFPEQGIGAYVDYQTKMNDPVAAARLEEIRSKAERDRARLQALSGLAGPMGNAPGFVPTSNRPNMMNTPGFVPENVALSVRNNNPTNIKDPTTGEFRSFETPDAGYLAAIEDLTTKVSGGSNAMRSKFGDNYLPTLENVIQTWAPPEDNNDTRAYVDMVSRASGIRPDQVLSVNDIPKILPAMTKMEGGSDAEQYFASSLPQVAPMAAPNLRGLASGFEDPVMGQQMPSGQPLNVSAMQQSQLQQKQTLPTNRAEEMRQRAEDMIRRGMDIQSIGLMYENPTDITYGQNMVQMGQDLLDRADKENIGPEPFSNIGKLASDVAKGLVKPEILEAEEKRLKQEQEKISSEAKSMAKGKETLDKTLKRMADNLKKLKEKGAIPSQENSFIGSPLAYLRNTEGGDGWITSIIPGGQDLGRLFQTEAQTLRDKLLTDTGELSRVIRKASGMSAQEMNSNVELQRFLDSLGSPLQSYETRMQVLKNLSQSYGNGTLSDDEENSLNWEDLQ